MSTVTEIGVVGGSASFLELDLASLSSCRRAAETVAGNGVAIDVLVNNAGIGPGRGTTKDGFEIHFGVNHLGHFQLTRSLSPSLAAGARVVTVTSAAHHRVSGIDYRSVRRRTRSITGLTEYSVSKLANILFVKELARRRPDLECHAVHPGLADTNIFPRFARPFVRRRAVTAEQAADTVIWCADSDAVSGQSGLYYARRQAREPSTAAMDPAMAEELWARSEEWCAGTLN